MPAMRSSLAEHVDGRGIGSRMRSAFPLTCQLYTKGENGRFAPLARMAEPVDAGDSKSPDGNIVRVRVSLWAFSFENQRQTAPDLEAVFDARKRAGCHPTIGMLTVEVKTGLSDGPSCR